MCKFEEYESLNLSPCLKNNYFMWILRKLAENVNVTCIPLKEPFTVGRIGKKKLGIHIKYLYKSIVNSRMFV